MSTISKINVILIGLVIKLNNLSIIVSFYLKIINFLKSWLEKMQKKRTKIKPH